MQNEQRLSDGTEQLEPQSRIRATKSNGYRWKTIFNIGKLRIQLHCKVDTQRPKKRNRRTDKSNPTDRTRGGSFRDERQLEMFSETEKKAGNALGQMMVDAIEENQIPNKQNSDWP